MSNLIKAILPITISSLLFGCGGGDSGSSSSTGSSFSIQLVTLQEDTLSNTNSDKCQVYYHSDGNALYYFATKVSDPTVALYNADGSLSSTLSVSDEGKVTVYENDIPSNGYLGITTETASQAITEYNVTAINADLLAAMTISVASSDDDGECISGSYSESSSKTGYTTIAIDGSEFSSAPAIYKFDNGEDVVTSASNTAVELTVYTDHPLLVTAYSSYDSDSDTASGMMGYALVESSDLCSKASCGDTIDLIPLDQTASVSYADNSTLDSATLKILDDSDIYSWQTLSSDDSEYGYSDVLDDASWFYTATGSDSNWTIERQAQITDPASGFDLTLAGSLDLSDTDPTISTSCTSSSYACVINSGVTASEYDWQRTTVSAYDTSNKSYVSMQIIGPAATQVVLPKAVDSNGSTLISNSLLSYGSVSVSLLSGSSNALWQAQRDDNLAAAPFYYGTVLKTLSQQETLKATLAQSNIISVSRSVEN